MTSPRLLVSAALILGFLGAAPVAAASATLTGSGSQPAAASGYDIAYPQCGGAFPAGQSFGIVAVNDGRANSLNPCLGPSSAYPQLSQSELYWAAASSGGVPSEAKAQLYVNTGDPGNSYQGTAVGDWPTSGSTPYGSCTTTASGSTSLGANSPACAYMYGYNKAVQDAGWLTAAAAGVNGMVTSSAAIATAPSAYPWWLDVETANTWQSAGAGQTMNVADLQGMVAGLSSSGATSIGIYSDSTQWEQITGVSTPSAAALGSLYQAPAWLPGATSLTGAEAACSASSFTGGTVPLTQWSATPFDEDYACSAAPAAAGGAYTALTPTRLLDTRVTGAGLGPQGTTNVTVAGVDSVPATASAVALNVTATDTTTSGYLSVYPAAGAQPLVSNLNWRAGETVANLVITKVGAGGQVTIFNQSGSTDVLVDLEGYFNAEPSGSTAGSYVPLAPARITDTRAGSGLPNAGVAVSSGTTLDVQVTGAGGVPTSGVAAALINVTVTETTAASYLTAYPAGLARPLASNLNWTKGETVANRVVVPVGSGGQISLYNLTGTTAVVVDVDGYFTDGSATESGASLFYPMTPVRVLDTRSQGGPLGAGTSLAEQMAQVDGIPAQATAVVLNVTAADTTAASYFTVYPGGQRPVASDVNWAAGEVVPNLTVATLSSGGALSVYNNAGQADLILDAFGYFSPTS